MMKFTRRAALAGCVAASVVLSAPVASLAQSSEPITIVVPYAGGGTIDALVRMLADGMSTELGQPVMVENLTFAIVFVGAQYVARSAPDGLTLLSGGTGPVSLNTLLRPDLPYTLDSFDSVAMLFEGSLSITVPSVLEVETLEEFVEFARNAGRPMRYGTLGPGSVTHLYGLMMSGAFGFDVVDVAYRNNPSSLVDLIAGQAEISNATPLALVEHQRAGDVRILALTTEERDPNFPDIPSIVELGHPELVASFWTALHAPAGTPPEAIERLSAAAIKAMENPALLEILGNSGMIDRAGGPDVLDAQLQRDQESWGAVVREHGIVLTD